MSDIRIVTAGRMTYYRYTGDELCGELYQLFCEANGAIIVSQGASVQKQTIPADSSALAEALSHIESLLSANADCACEKRPKHNEIYMQDGTYRFAPYDELFAVLETLYRQVRAEASAENLHPAGAVAAEPTPPWLIEAVQLQGIVSCQQPQDPMKSFKDMMQQQTPAPAKAVLHDDGTWDCVCGVKGLTAKFCYECGTPMPSAEWKCPSCGTVNKSRFCMECGAPRPQE